MKHYNRFTILIFLVPVFLGLLFVLYYQESWKRMMDRLVRSGVVAIYEGGTVSREDIQSYFAYPPVTQGPILRALELNPEDVNGLEQEDPEWLDSRQFQILLNRVIKHIALVEYLNELPEATDVESVQQEIKEYKEELLIHVVEQELAKIKPEVTRKEMLAYYLKHREEFYREGKRYARHIMFYEEELGEEDDPFGLTVESVWERLQMGEDFRDLIFETTPDSISNVGELGWLTKGALAEPFDRALWSLDVREITGPIQVNNTYHFIQLMDKEPEGLIPFEKCIPQLKEILLEKKRMNKQYALLGLSDDLLNMSDAESSKTYREAVLRSAYSLEIDQSMEVAQKSEAFSKYHIADTLFERYLRQHVSGSHRQKRGEPSWSQESETLKQLMGEMEFRYLVKLDIPSSEREETEEQTDETKESLR